MKTLNYWACLLLLVILNFLYELYGPSTDTYETLGYAGAIGAASGTTLIGLLLGAFFWIPLRFFKGSEGAPGIRDYSLKSAYVICALSVAIVYLFTPTNESLSQKDREDIFRGASQSCVKYNTLMQDDIGLSDEEIKHFCECYGRTLSQDISYQEALEVIETGNALQSLEIKKLAAKAWCSEGF